MEHVTAIYDILTGEGLKVWWDQRCLSPGVSWKEGFTDGLVRSRIFMPVLSREAINSNTNTRANFSALQTDSAVDNVLLEHHLALELFERGLIEKVYPVMIGDKYVNRELGTQQYGNYFADGCDPKLVDDVMVESIQVELHDHLKRLCLGTPLLENMSVQRIKAALLINQGRFIEKSLKASLEGVAADVKNMTTSILSRRASVSSSNRHSRSRSYFAGGHSPRSPRSRAFMQQSQDDGSNRLVRGIPYITSSSPRSPISPRQIGGGGAKRSVAQNDSAEQKDEEMGIFSPPGHSSVDSEVCTLSPRNVAFEMETSMDV
jgi:hypothetical protein